MPQTTGSRLFAQMLQGYGVTHVFFVPTILMEALAEMDALGIRKILTHGEKAAAYMADGYARASGAPGICMAQQIGASNLAAGLRDAYMGHSPVIAVTGGPAGAGRYRSAYQEVEDLAQFDCVTKLNMEVDELARLPDLIRQAFRVATGGSPGPVHLRLRGSHGQGIDAEGDLSAHAEPRFARVPAFRPPPEPTAIEHAARLLATAGRPVIVAGGGIVASGAQAELTALAERMQIPVVTSLTAKGAILDTHPLAAGVVGTYSRACANKVVAQADLVFFAGNHTGGQLTHNWRLPPPGTAVIQLDIDPDQLGRNYPNAVQLLGDAKLALAQLIDATPGTPPASRAEWVGRVQGLVREWRAAAEPQLTSDAAPMRPERICREITRALPPDGVLVSDTGHAGMWTGQMVDITHPGQRFIRCEGSLGWGLPGAMGVKCALPQRPVLLFTGDGGLYYHLSELETAARHGIALVVLVNNNSALNQEIPLVNAAYREKSDRLSGELWRFSASVDLAKVAEALGCVGWRVDTPAELARRLPEAFGMGRPVVLDCRSDDRALAATAWLPPGTKTGH